MKHLTINEGYIRLLEGYAIGMGCVLDVARGVCNRSPELGVTLSF